MFRGDFSIFIHGSPHCFCDNEWLSIKLAVFLLVFLIRDDDTSTRELFLCLRAFHLSATRLHYPVVLARFHKLENLTTSHRGLRNLGVSHRSNPSAHPLYFRCFAGILGDESKSHPFSENASKNSSPIRAKCGIMGTGGVIRNEYE